MKSKRFPPLYKVDSKGKIRVWTIEVPDTTGLYIMTAGVRGGKLQAHEKLAFPKNVGKANETTPFDQAVSEAQSLWNKKKDSGYKETVVLAQQKKTLPMLAKKYLENAHRVAWPMLVQPKLNGVRCIATRIGNTIKFVSRTNKEFKTLHHLIDPLLKIMKDGQVFDGEIYLHGWALQDIRRILVKYYPMETPNLEYWVYDMQSDDPFTARYYQFYTQIGDVPKADRGNVRRLWCDLVYNEKEMKEYFNKFLSLNYEGIMIRDLDAAYQFGKRSHYLLKYKEFHDEEFEIVGATAPITGKHQDCVIWVCQTETGKQFECVPKGTIAQRKEWYENREDYIGKLLTIRYQEKSNDGTPTILTGIAIRDYE